MTKQRRPGTIEAALWRAKEILGLETLADIIGKSESMITHYTNIDDESRNLPAKYIVAIDAACKAETGETPMTSHLMDRISRAPSSPSLRVEDAMLAAHCAMGALTNAVVAGLSPTGPGGRRLTDRELHKVEEGGQMLKNDVDRLLSTARHDSGTDLKAVS